MPLPARFGFERMTLHQWMDVIRNPQHIRQQCWIEVIKINEKSLSDPQTRRLKKPCIQPQKINSIHFAEKRTAKYTHTGQLKNSPVISVKSGQK
jgi:hypothetical protein